jgi:hypothetical protein
MPKSQQRAKARLKLPRYEVLQLIGYARAIVRSMASNPRFPSPDPPLEKIDEAIVALDAAQTATCSRTAGTVPARDEKRRVLAMRLDQLLTHIQATADADPDSAASIIESAGVHVEKARTVPARAFTAKRGKVSGSVALTAPWTRGAAYDWAVSLDGGETWTSLPVTVKAKTTVASLTPGTRALCRCRTITSDGARAWSDPVAIIVD